MTLPTVVMIHGLGECSFHWEQAAARTKLRPVVEDLPFHGGRELDRAVNIDALVDDVVETCARLSIRSAVFAGTSIGSVVGMIIAERFPNLVDGLLLVSPVWVPRQFRSRTNARHVRKMGALMRRRGLPFTWEVVRNLPPVSTWTSQEQERYRERFLAFDVEATSVALTELPSAAPDLHPELLRQRGVTSGVIAWTDDQVHSLPVAVALASELQSRLVWTGERPKTLAAQSALLADALDALFADGDSGDFCAKYAGDPTWT